MTDGTISPPTPFPYNNNTIRLQRRFVSAREIKPTNTQKAAHHREAVQVNTGFLINNDDKNGELDET